jgi:hypothetical protein
MKVFMPNTLVGQDKAGQIVAPRLILSDPIMHSVHWAFVKDNQ